MAPSHTGRCTRMTFLPGASVEHLRCTVQMSPSGDSLSDPRDSRRRWAVHCIDLPRGKRGPSEWATPMARWLPPDCHRGGDDDEGTGNRVGIHRSRCRACGCAGSTWATWRSAWTSAATGAVSRLVRGRAPRPSAATDELPPGRAARGTRSVCVDRLWPIPSVPIAGGYFYGPRRHTGAISLAFEYGYEDGFAGARSDLRRHGAYDPARHKGYRSADRGYHKRYGARRHYRDLYREGFWAGYDGAYRDAGRYRRDGFAIVGTFRWPF